MKTPVQWIYSKDKIICAQIGSLMIFRHGKEYKKDFKKRVYEIKDKLEQPAEQSEEINGM